ncbi:hypothetical protein RJ639_033631 [Escallonia herrerae]|uniref:Uncharacterized protein n=1 Tax=Escallonia herrerae TaxID=1293975 RepID=A0AA88WV83_9ASTE|nr:hypothetical protein RJ639_033631 [Escallonia herrerae]
MYTKTPARQVKINFGGNAVVSGPGVVSTPLIIEDLYYLKLEGVSVGHKRLPYKTNKAGTVQRGNILIDSDLQPSSTFIKVQDDMSFSRSQMEPAAQDVNELPNRHVPRYKSLFEGKLLLAMLTLANFNPKR